MLGSSPSSESLNSIGVELANAPPLDLASAAFEGVTNGRITPLETWLQANPDQNLYLLKDGDGNTALHRAASSDQTSAQGMARLLALFCDDVDPQNDQGQTPLHLAAEQGNLMALSALLEAGAAANQADKESDTALLKALRRKFSAELRLELITQLVEAGADVNTAKNGGTPLHSAAWHGDLNVVQYLIEAPGPNKGALLNTLWNNKTPLCVAAEMGHQEVVTYLLGKGAKLEIGKSAAQAARENGHLAIASQIDKATPLRPISKPSSRRVSEMEDAGAASVFDPAQVLATLATHQGDSSSSRSPSPSSKGSLSL